MTFYVAWFWNYHFQISMNLVTFLTSTLLFHVILFDLSSFKTVSETPSVYCDIHQQAFVIE